MLDLAWRRFVVPVPADSATCRTVPRDTRDNDADAVNLPDIKSQLVPPERAQGLPHTRTTHRRRSIPLNVNKKKDPRTSVQTRTRRRVREVREGGYSADVHSALTFVRRYSSRLLTPERPRPTLASPHVHSALCIFLHSLLCLPFSTSEHAPHSPEHAPSTCESSRCVQRLALASMYCMSSCYPCRSPTHESRHTHTRIPSNGSSYPGCCTFNPIHSLHAACWPCLHPRDRDPACIPSGMPTGHASLQIDASTPSFTTRRARVDLEN